MTQCTTCVPCPALRDLKPCLLASMSAKPGATHPGYADGEDKQPGKDRPCPCRICCCGKPPIAEFCYEQPKIPESFAPKRCWMKPTVPVDSRTTYRSSYVPPEDCLIPAEKCPTYPALGLDRGPISEKTTYRLSYLPNPVCQVPPVRPCFRPMFGEGPMENTTNYRREYIPKPIEIPESCRPGRDNLTKDGEMSDLTTSRLNYLDPGRHEIPPSWAPKKCWEKPVEKMSSDTTNRASFLPICVFSPETPPWAKKPPYKAPSKKMATTTVKKLSYLPPGRDCSSIVDQCMYGTCKLCDCTSPAQCIKTEPCACVMPTGVKAALCR